MKINILYNKNDKINQYIKYNMFIFKFGKVKNTIKNIDIIIKD